MLKLYVVLIAFFIYSIQCAPIEEITQTSANQKTLHLHVKNSTEATNYHLTPIINELGNIDEEVNEELEAILPYINFLFDLFSHGSEVQNDECLDDMVIQLVPDLNDKKAEQVTDKPTEELVTSTSSSDII